MNTEQPIELVKLESKIKEIEKSFEDKLNHLVRYRKARLTFNIITFASIACLLFFRSSHHSDIYLWVIGTFMVLLAFSELLDLEEARVTMKKKTKSNN